MATIKDISDAAAYEIRNARSWIFDYSSVIIKSDKLIHISLSNGQKFFLKISEANKKNKKQNKKQKTVGG